MIHWIRSIFIGYGLSDSLSFLFVKSHFNIFMEIRLLHFELVDNALFFMKFEGFLILAIPKHFEIEICDFALYLFEITV